ncbi:hypothetical protein OG203_20705 [Nocardia sp. NBC_01499]|uniref:MAB_1171c family putative transporter n=1 Tax=Nocardia sp. NBC_01499 TaxID=2903597 RepID=UPI00386EC9B7
MTQPAPTWLAAAALAFAFVVVVARWLLVNETFANRLVNRVLSWLTGGAAIEVLGSGTDLANVTYRVFLGCNAITIAYIYGLAALFGGVDEDRARRRQVAYNTVAVVGAVVVMFIGRPADPLEPSFGWKSPLVWAILNVPWVLLGIHVVRACVRELRVAGIAVRERLAFSVLLLAAVYAIYGVVASGLQVFGGQPSESPPADWTTAACLSYLVITALLSAQVVGALLAQAGWDRTGRRCRRLWPLWRDLTTVVPGIVLDKGPAHRDPDLRLYRMSIEIQDALQHLKQYMPPADRHSVESYAVQIARAADSKRRGAPPAVAVHDQREPSRAMGSQLDDLLELARVWPAARAAASADIRVA